MVCDWLARTTRPVCPTSLTTLLLATLCITVAACKTATVSCSVDDDVVSTEVVSCKEWANTGEAYTYEESFGCTEREGETCTCVYTDVQCSGESAD